MNNTENDEAMKHMLESSMMEITNPQFNNIIMDKIMSADRKRFILKKITLYFLVFVTISLAVIFIVWSSFGPDIARLPQIISGSIEQTGVWLSENIYFIAPLFILVIVKQIMTSGLKRV